MGADRKVRTRVRCWHGILAAALIAGCGGGGAAEPESASGDPVAPADTVWTLVWHDEFDGTDLDATRWSVQTGDGCDYGICGWGNDELQWYQADNATVADGVLTITARREAGLAKGYTSARLRTAGKADWTYARIEARARLPRGQGLWPAIWMLPTDGDYGGWAASGEIDIMELVGHEPATVLGTLHYGGEWPSNRHTGASFTLPSGTFADDFHVFGLEWEEGEMRWYVDGELYQTQTEWTTAGAQFPAPFDRRFHLLVNLAVGGRLPGNPDASTVLPQRLEIDWIRVYQRR